MRPTHLHFPRGQSTLEIRIDGLSTSAKLWAPRQGQSNHQLLFAIGNHQHVRVLRMNSPDEGNPWYLWVGNASLELSPEEALQVRTAIATHTGAIEAQPTSVGVH